MIVTKKNGVTASVEESLAYEIRATIHHLAELMNEAKAIGMTVGFNIADAPQEAPELGFVPTITIQKVTTF